MKLAILLALVLCACATTPRPRAPIWDVDQFDVPAYGEPHPDGP